MPDEASLQRDLQDAMRARERVRIDVLRGLIAAVKNLKIEKRVAALDEAEILALIRKEASKRVEIADFAKRAERADALAQAEDEKAILDAYLPAQMDAAALEAAIRAIAAGVGTTQIGPVMAELRKRHSGQFDGKLASELIRKIQVG
ncbi:MAG: GatB/YqeY domain-containing protein [Candidatus Binatia bacterium]